MSLKDMASQIMRLAESKITRMCRELDTYLTPLAILVIMICGSVIILISAYLFRYRNYYSWFWKKRCVTRILYLAAILFAIKIILAGYSR